MLNNFKWYRRLVGGVWYKYTMNGNLPNCYGTFWTQKKDNSRYVSLLKTENYE